MCLLQNGINNTFDFLDFIKNHGVLYLNVNSSIRRLKRLKRIMQFLLLNMVLLHILYGLV